MFSLYTPAARALQDRFDTRRLADRVAEVQVHDRFTPKERSFIERLDMLFLATGNVDATQRVGLLFIDFERQRRIRVDGTAELRHDDRLLERYPAAQFVVRVHAERIYPNCPRYIHKYQLVERSAFVPRVGAAPPIPGWKQSDWARDVLPAGDPARGVTGGEDPASNRRGQ